jgi:RsiW-degrading membrane proteinase PrsW (M82 family)
MAIGLIPLAAALFPAFFLLRYIYKTDTIEKEPPQLLWKLFFFGALSGIVAGYLESVGEIALASVFARDSTHYIIAFAFMVVAVIEEGVKFLVLKRLTWSHPAFNYRYDGVVYAVFVSLGFAALENVAYLYTFGISVLLPRALLAVPAHMGLSVFMGAYYGRAKVLCTNGDGRGCTVNLWISYLSAVFLHGFYDACIMLQNPISNWIFLFFVVIMYNVVIRRIKHEAVNDRLIR